MLNTFKDRHKSITPSCVASSVEILSLLIDTFMLLIIDLLHLWGNNHHITINPSVIEVFDQFCLQFVLYSYTFMLGNHGNLFKPLINNKNKLSVHLPCIFFGTSLLNYFPSCLASMDPGEESGLDSNMLHVFCSFNHTGCMFCIIFLQR